jgi:hypothetical protein
MRSISLALKQKLKSAILKLVYSSHPIFLKYYNSSMCERFQNEKIYIKKEIIICWDPRYHGLILNWLSLSLWLYFLFLPTGFKCKKENETEINWSLRTLTKYNKTWFQPKFLSGVLINDKVENISPSTWSCQNF